MPSAPNGTGHPASPLTTVMPHGEDAAWTLPATAVHEMPSGTATGCDVVPSCAISAFE